jgi:23S rRNA pseudouridine1911/1915/1917 synthase
MEILFEDNDLIVLNKPATIPMQADKTGDESLQAMVENYCKHKVFLVHRIDRPVSGVAVFAKNESTAKIVSEQFKQHSTKKIYWAIVQNKPEKERAVVTHYIKKMPKTNKSVASTTKESDAKKAVLKYHVLHALERYFLLEIELMTGRFHQIRAQLSAMGSPIKGDVKYGAKRNNPDRAIHLHARQLTLAHPVTKAELRFTANPPADAIWDNCAKF